ncbi:D-alanyl-D-alanine carboxypeptidase family protein [Blautia sp. MSJ-19]|uniref:D-alanyl-D-alanine carboxypeptidase family protein n=1 Tax=Blautia sp. MSJ-19 TaxID=2841517 RepID=UPI001C0F08BD|nr:D-alanyl-D-alanine carboxypeptidase family protein [Blautia sp. MSJ-19]MBU5481061.1 D-alanyl-D-alanine carboxypeptidase [Blautia sp. MSJ-19]
MKNRIYRIAAALSVAALLVSSATVQAAGVTTNGTPAAVATDSVQNWPTAPAVASETAVLIDADTGAVLYDKGMDEYRYPASTTKLMTLLVAIENSSPKDSVTFTETGIRDVSWDSSNINAQLGETMTMKDCWMAAYIQSANEVCAQIAEYVGGSEANFVEMMNQKAKELGCTHTHFVNASGLPDENHYSSAHDLAKIMRACLKNKRFRQVMKCTSYKIPATNTSQARSLHTHLPLMAQESDLYYEGCIGGKTGFATEAQHTMVAAAERNGRTYIVVTMRDAELGTNCTDSRALFDYAFDNFDSIDINGTQMTVPKGVTVNDLTTDTAERNGKTLNRYYYSGQFVGYVVQADPTATPSPEPETQTAETTESTDSGTSAEEDRKSMTQQLEEIRSEGMSSSMRTLLIAMGVMAGILVILLIALYIKNG